LKINACRHPPHPEIGRPVFPGTGKLSRDKGFHPVLGTLDFAIGAIRKWQDLTHGPEDRVTMEFMVEIHASERSPEIRVRTREPIPEFFS